MNFESPSGILKNQEVEKVKTDEEPNMDRRAFLRWSAYTAATAGTALTLGYRKTLWDKAKDFIVKRRKEILGENESGIRNGDEDSEGSNLGNKEENHEAEEVKTTLEEELSTEESQVSDAENVDSQESIKEVQEPEEAESPKTENREIESQENENIFGKYADAYDELSKQDKYFPEKLFPKDLLIAQQFQESKYDKNAVSHAGAVGVMQNMPISIEDVCGTIEYSSKAQEPSSDKKVKLAKVIKTKKEHEGYLHKLYRKKHLKTKVPKGLHHNEIDTIVASLTTPDNSRIMGKLYLMQIWDNKSGYGVGRDLFAKGDLEGAQNEILGAYNAGYKRIKGKPMEKWLKEPREYAENIQKFKKMIGDIRLASERELDGKEVLKVLKKIYFVKNEEKRKKVIDNMLASI